MTEDRPDDLRKKPIRLADGRYLIYYEFPVPARRNVPNNDLNNDATEDARSLNKKEN